MATERLSRAFASSRGVLANVTREQLHGTTPCRSWDVAALVNHMVGAPRFAVGVLTTGGDVDTGREDFTTGDFLSAYEDTAAAAVTACHPGALGRTVTLPFGDLPGQQFMMIVATDQFTHGWDLARATGQPTDLDPELAAELLALAEVLLPDQYRGEDGQAAFGPKRDAPAGSSEADHLAAFLGRSV